MCLVDRRLPAFLHADPLNWSGLEGQQLPLTKKARDDDSSLGWEPQRYCRAVPTRAENTAPLGAVIREVPALRTWPRQSHPKSPSHHDGAAIRRRDTRTSRQDGVRITPYGARHRTSSSTKPTALRPGLKPAAGGRIAWDTRARHRRYGVPQFAVAVPCTNSGASGWRLG